MTYRHWTEEEHEELTRLRVLPRELRSHFSGVTELQAFAHRHGRTYLAVKAKLRRLRKGKPGDSTA